MFGSSWGSRSAQDRLLKRLRLEELEPRCLLAASTGPSLASFLTTTSPAAVLGTQQPGETDQTQVLTTQPGANAQSSGTTTGSSPSAQATAGAIGGAIASLGTPTPPVPIVGPNAAPFILSGSPISPGFSPNTLPVAADALSPVVNPLSSLLLFPSSTLNLAALSQPQTPPPAGQAPSIPVAGGPGLAGSVPTATPNSPVPPTEFISPASLISPLDLPLISPLRIPFPRQESGGGQDPVLLPTQTPPSQYRPGAASLFEPENSTIVSEVHAKPAPLPPVHDDGNWETQRADVAIPKDVPATARDVYFARWEKEGPRGVPALAVSPPQSEPAPDPLAAATVLALTLGGWWGWKNEKRDE